MIVKKIQKLYNKIMQKFLFIKPAHIEDEYLRYNTQEDILSLEQTLIKIYRDISIDICSITFDNEWLIHGRKINPELRLESYDRVFIFIHNSDKTIDIAKANTKLFSNKCTYLYKVEDNMFHHAERLENHVNINNTSNIKIKFPAQKHINIKKYNDDLVTTPEIVGKYMRQLFLPIHTLPTHHSIHRAHKDINLSYNANEFIENLDRLRHKYNELTFREYIDGRHVYMAVIPDFRDEEYYLCLPLIEKNVNGVSMFDVAHLNMIEKEGVKNITENLSKICFPKQAVVYKLSLHGKRGIFIQHTSSVLTYLLYYPDFIFETAGSLGIDIEEFVNKIF